MPTADLDIGVIYTGEPKLMPQLLDHDGGLGRRAADAARAGR